jgi:hypothetical protein
MRACFAQTHTAQLRKQNKKISRKSTFRNVGVSERKGDASERKDAAFAQSKYIEASEPPRSPASLQPILLALPRRELRIVAGHPGRNGLEERLGSGRAADLRAQSETMVCRRMSSREGRTRML